MAYLDLNALHGRPIAAPIEIVETAAPVATGLSGLEWSVVAIAQRDTLGSLREPGRIAVALGLLFGDKPNTRLADPKLEALRRVAVHAWHKGYAVPLSEIRAFHAVGYTHHQYETLLASISAGRAARTNRQGTLQ